MRVLFLVLFCEFLASAASAPPVLVEGGASRPGVRLLAPAGDGWWWARLDASARRTLRTRTPSPESKLTREAGRAVWSLSGEPQDRTDVQVYYFADTDTAELQRRIVELGGAILRHAPFFERYTVRFPADELRRLAELGEVMAIDSIPPPPNTQNNSTSAELIRVDQLQGSEFGLTGTGVLMGEWDGGIVQTHRDFDDRLTALETGAFSEHATHVAGTMAGSGASDPRLKGMSPGARIFSGSFNGDVPTKMLRAVEQQSIVTSQNSWSFTIGETTGNCNSFGDYTGSERDYDRLARLTNLTIVFSAANNRNNGDCAMHSRTGFYTLGRPASAKNLIAVGAVDSNLNIATFSSYGPTRDGRLKPDVVAMGVSVRSTGLNNGSVVMSGTSMSAPAVSGTVGLLIERFRSRNNGANPSPALVKALLANTARDLGNPGPDFSYGYGLVNAREAVRAIDDRQWARGAAGEAVQRSTIAVPGSAPRLRVMLAYQDTEGLPGVESSLINDLDLVLRGPDGREYLPLVLDPRAPTANAQPGVNSRDNVEQIVIDQPAAGEWTIEVHGRRVAQGEQEYFLTWTFAADAAAPCSTMVVPTSIFAEPGRTTVAAAVTAANQCPAWTIANSTDWITTPGGENAGARAVRFTVNANDSGRTRSANVNIAGRLVAVHQNIPCPQNLLSPGTLTAMLSLDDCFAIPNSLSLGKHFSFDAQQGQRVSFLLGSDAFDSFLELRAPDGRTLVTDDDGGGALNSRIPARAGFYTLPQSGRFTLIARSLGTRAAGAFTLTMELADPAALTGGVPRVTNFTGCPARGEGTLGPDSSRLSRRGDLYPSDFFTFPGRAGQEVTLHLEAQGFDGVLYLISPSGRLASSSEGEPGAGSRVTQVLGENGPWRVEVSSFAPFASGAYSLAAEGCTPNQ